MSRTSLKVWESGQGGRGVVPAGRADRVYAAYMEKLDPRGNDQIQLALASSSDVRFKEFLERINTPRYRKVGLVTIAKACKISLAEFNNWWNKESTQRALAIAQTGSVRITQDMVEDAKSVEVGCPRCEGLKFIPAPPGLPDDTEGYRMITPPTAASMAQYIRDCPNCLAAGRIRKPGDAHARDRVLEMTGLVKKGAAFQIVQNFGGASHASAIADWDKLVTIDIDSEAQNG